MNIKATTTTAVTRSDMLQTKHIDIMVTPFLRHSESRNSG